MLRVKNNEYGVVNYLIIVLIVGLVIASISFTWLKLNNSKDATKSDNKTNFSDQSSSQNTDTKKTSEQQARQVVYVNESDFSSSEKEKLIKYLVNPYYDYSEMFKNSSDYNPITSFKISRYSDTELNSKSYAKYRYAVVVENKNGKSEFLYGDNDLIDWWIPICEYSCNINEEFKTKYPEIISTMTKQGIKL